MICPVCNAQLKEDGRGHAIYCPACSWFIEDCFDEDTINE